MKNNITKENNSFGIIHHVYDDDEEEDNKEYI
jgi:hypothetical protein